ncbi:MAG TPA: hypothetical protein DCY80_13365, partial [Solibacterales bacterium]|nr:hypothetical protein [Bryobacterales bacterium]
AAPDAAINERRVHCMIGDQGISNARGQGLRGDNAGGGAGFRSSGVALRQPPLRSCAAGAVEGGVDGGGEIGRAPA